MTGNDTLNARFLHENSFDFQPQFKLYEGARHEILNDFCRDEVVRDILAFIN